MKAKKLVLGHIFPHIIGSIRPIVSKNSRVHPCVDPHQPSEFHENRFKIAACIATSYTHKRNISILTLLVCNANTYPLMKSSVRIVVISFQNMAKNNEKLWNSR